MNISSEQAHRLFAEARGFVREDTPYISADSEIRQIAMTVFGQNTIITLSIVCSEIFYVLACELKKVDR